MLKDIITVKPLTNYVVYIEFEDMAKGEVDIEKIIQFTGVFAPLKDKSFFDKVFVDKNLGTIAWPNEADLDPDVLYAILTNSPIQVGETVMPDRR